MKADKEAGNIIPRGSDGNGESIPELQLALEALHKVVALGVAKRWQHLLASRIYDALEDVTKWHDENGTTDW